MLIIIDVINLTMQCVFQERKLLLNFENVTNAKCGVTLKQSNVNNRYICNAKVRKMTLMVILYKAEDRSIEKIWLNHTH